MPELWQFAESGSPNIAAGSASIAAAACTNSIWSSLCGAYSKPTTSESGAFNETATVSPSTTTPSSMTPCTCCASALAGARPQIAIAQSSARREERTYGVGKDAEGSVNGGFGMNILRRLPVSGKNETTMMRKSVPAAIARKDA